MNKLHIKALIDPLNIIIFICYLSGFYILHILIFDESINSNLTLEEIIQHTKVIFNMIKEIFV